MGNNNNINLNKKDEEKDKKIEDKMEMKDEVKITEIHEPAPVIEEKKPVVVQPTTSNNLNKKEDPKKVIEKKIAELEANIKDWSNRVARTKNSLDKAIYDDKILQANIKIAELRGNLNPVEKKVEDCKVATISDEKQPTPESWRFFL